MKKKQWAENEKENNVWLRALRQESNRELQKKKKSQMNEWHTNKTA